MFPSLKLSFLRQIIVVSFYKFAVSVHNFFQKKNFLNFPFFRRIKDQDQKIKKSKKKKIRKEKKRKRIRSRIYL